MAKIRAGVVGVGYLGKFHAQKYAAMENVELAGVADINKTQAEIVARQSRCTAYPDFHKLFGEVDAVSIAVPTPMHFEVARAFLEHNADVLVEKPITPTIEEADELIRIARDRGRILQVGHLERFNPAVMAIKPIVDHPVFIESNRLSFYKDRGTDVSVVLDLMIHDIDIILSFIHARIRYSHAMGVSVVSDKVDIANAHLEFENGAVANFTASRISNKNERKIRLFQRNGYISVDFANRSIIHVRPGAEDQNCPIPGMHMEERTFAEGDALAAEIRSFIDAVIHRRVPEVTGPMGRDALKVALSITAQIKETSRRFNI